MGSWWHRHIVEPGKLPLLLCAVAFLVTFVVTRAIVRSIRAGRGPFRNNVSEGGLHVHHMVPGLILLLVGGVFGLASPSEPWWSISAVVFGIGAALVLDEFSLILHLDDVYWSEQGRLSVDAVFLTAGLLLLLLVGASPLGVDGLDPSERATRWVLVTNLLVSLAFVVIVALKSKYITAAIGLFVPFVAVVSALRLARPSSPWARWFYRRKPQKLLRAQRRSERARARWARAGHRIQDLVAGAPTQEHSTGIAEADGEVARH